MLKQLSVTKTKQVLEQSQDFEEGNGTAWIFLFLKMTFRMRPGSSLHLVGMLKVKVNL